MRHRHRSYRAFGRGHAASMALQLLGRMPRWLKISLAIAAVLMLVLVLLVVLLFVQLLISLLGGGTLPGVVQRLLEWAQDNLQPLLDLWRALQGLNNA